MPWRYEKSIFARNFKLFILHCQIAYQGWLKLLGFRNLFQKLRYHFYYFQTKKYSSPPKKSIITFDFGISFCNPVFKQQYLVILHWITGLHFHDMWKRSGNKERSIFKVLCSNIVYLKKYLSKLSSSAYLNHQHQLQLLDVLIGYVATTYSSIYISSHLMEKYRELIITVSTLNGLPPPS